MKNFVKNFVAWFIAFQIGAYFHAAAGTTVSVTMSLMGALLIAWLRGLIDNYNRRVPIRINGNTGSEEDEAAWRNANKQFNDEYTSPMYSYLITNMWHSQHYNNNDNNQNDDHDYNQ